MLLLDSAISKKQDLLSKDLGFALLGCRFRGLNDQRDGIPYNPYDFTLPFIPSLSFRLNFICCALRLRLLFLLSPPISLCWDHRPLKRWSHLYLSCQKLNTAQPCNSLMVFFQFNMQTIFVISLKSLIVCQLNDCISTSSHVYNWLLTVRCVFMWFAQTSFDGTIHIRRCRLNQRGKRRWQQRQQSSQWWVPTTHLLVCSLVVCQLLLDICP